MAGIQDQAGLFGFQGLTGEAFRFAVQRGLELADGPDLPDGDALHMHLDERGHQRPPAFRRTSRTLPHLRGTSLRRASLRPTSTANRWRGATSGFRRLEAGGTVRRT